MELPILMTPYGKGAAETRLTEFKESYPNPSIHSRMLILIRVMGGLEATHETLGKEAGIQTGQVAERQTIIHTHGEFKITN